MEKMSEHGQGSLAQALENQYDRVQGEVQVREKNAEKGLAAGAAEDTTPMQFLTSIENISSQLGALMVLDKSTVGFVVA